MSEDVGFPPLNLTLDDVNSGDTAWVLMSTALVMFMTPGLAQFYGGRFPKN